MTKLGAPPNMVNQEEIAFLFQDLKLRLPRVWQALVSLRVYSEPMIFSYDLVFPGKQNVNQDALGYRPTIRMPIDPYGVWIVDSVTIQSIEVTCDIPPSTSDYIADILVTRNKRSTYVSIFTSTSSKIRLKVGAGYSRLIDGSNIGTELFDGDELRGDIIQADSSISGVWICLRGYYNLRKFKK